MGPRTLHLSTTCLVPRTPSGLQTSCDKMTPSRRYDPGSPQKNVMKSP